MVGCRESQATPSPVNERCEYHGYAPRIFLLGFTRKRPLWVNPNLGNLLDDIDRDREHARRIHPNTNVITHSYSYVYAMEGAAPRYCPNTCHSILVVAMSRP